VTSIPISNNLILLPDPRSHIKHRTQTLEVLGCAPIPMPNLHTHYSSVWYTIDCVATRLPACSQAEKPSVAQPWPLLVALRPACRRRARETVSTADKTRSSFDSEVWCARDMVSTLLETLVTPSEEDVFSRVMSTLRLVHLRWVN
jgi:hypothetical protein